MAREPEKQACDSLCKQNEVCLHGLGSARVAWLLFWGVEGIGVKAGIEVRNGLEYHAGHAADHTTALTHRLRAAGRRSASVQVDAHGNTKPSFQLTTPLEAPSPFKKREM